MEWKNNLRRAQSLKSVPSSGDKPIWTEAGHWDKKVSVSQLVSRYQTTVEVTTSVQPSTVTNGETKPKRVIKEMTPSLLQSKEMYLSSLTKQNNERDWSPAKSGLTRAKSMGSLHNSPGSIKDLRARFETKPIARSRAADVLVNGEVVESERSAEEPKTKSLTAAPVRDAPTHAKEDQVTHKVVNKQRAARRKTIGGIDFEEIAASHADDQRRSIADFRDSSFIQTEKPSVSVKLLSALYLSKAAPRESTLQLGQHQSSESGRRTKLTKMSEDLQQRKADLALPPLTGSAQGADDISEEHSQKSLPDQLSKERFYQQRQKCELKRLLKHTHPELKKLDEAVDDELAEVLSSETERTAGETGYEGEVFSRRLIFENCALSDRVSHYTPKKHMADGRVDEGTVCKKPALFDKQVEGQCQERVKEIVQDQDDKSFGSTPDPNRECKEAMVRIDVQASRRIFESESVTTSRPKPDSKFLGKVSINRGDGGPAKTQIHDLELSSGEMVPSDDATFDDDDFTSLPDPGGSEEMIKTHADLSRNNPFISANIETENVYMNTSKSRMPAQPNTAFENQQLANVKDRTHLFESMPFDKIKHQNKDDIETMVENIRETLKTLYDAKAIYSDGSIIEVSETMIAKKAKFTLSGSGPDIQYDELAEGSAQNFIVQLLPRSNLKPHIMYLKEDSERMMVATAVTVPLHQHHINISQDTEFKTANVAQVVEDILNQDNSLRKGVIIQKDAKNCHEVIVYSLYNYFDEEDVKTYSAPHYYYYDEPEKEEVHVNQTETQELRKGTVESMISSLLETPRDQTCTASVRPEVTVKGNVKLFKSCIEKGDLEYLKTLQSEATEQEQELPRSQREDEQSTQFHNEQRSNEAEESFPEWVPVDVKRLRSMFSADQRQNQAKQNIQENYPQTLSVSRVPQGETMPLGKSQSSKECREWILADGQRNDNVLECSGATQRELCKVTDAPQGYYLHPVPPDADMILQAELVEVVDDVDEISNLQSAILDLQQATSEAKSLYQSSQNKQKTNFPKSLQQPVVLDDVQAELLQQNEGEEVDLYTDQHWDEAEKEPKQEEPGEEEVDFHGKLQQALDSLERSNINVTRGDFKTAMMYKNTSSLHKVDKESVQKANTGEVKQNVIAKESESFVGCPQTQCEQQGEEQVDFQGRFQEALESLEKSNVNVTRGDFKAAMMYKSSNRHHSDGPHKVDNESGQNIRPIQEDAVQKAPEPTVDLQQITCEQQEEDQVDFQGKFQEALDSLGRSNINTKIGDFKTAMIYKNSSRLREDRLHNADKEYIQKHNTKDCFPVPASGSSQIKNVQEDAVQKELGSTDNRETKQEEDEVDFQGKFQEALDSLGRSNINVTRGDFKAAMIYKNSPTPHDERLLDNKPSEKPIKELCPLTESRSTPIQADVVQKDSETNVDCPQIHCEQQQEDEVDFQGRFQEALESLQRSNVNVTRGDFKAAMIYQNSSKHNEDKSPVDNESVQKAVSGELSPINVFQSTPNKPETEDVTKRESLVQTKCKHQEEGEVDFQGRFKEALDSLQRSNVNVTKGDFKAAMIYKNSSTAHHNKLVDNVDKESGQKPIGELPTMATYSSIDNNPTQGNLVQKQIETSFDCTQTKCEQQAEDEVDFQRNFQDALDSLEKSNINVTRGDFKAAMIYKNASRPHQDILKTVDKESGLKSISGDLCPQSESGSTEDNMTQDISRVNAANAELQNQSETPNKPVTTAAYEKTQQPKPALPPKPPRINVIPRENTSNTKNSELTNSSAQSHEEAVAQSLTTSSPRKDDHMTKDSRAHSGSTAEGIHKSKDSFDIANDQQGKIPVKDSTSDEPAESHIDFHEACQMFGGKKLSSVKNAPVKPKRVKIAQPNNVIPNEKPTLTSESQQPITGPSHTGVKTTGSKVAMREKRGRTETEDERRQRLSVHMDEIMRGNITTAMEIFDNLRKQEELENILSRVEEIEQDTSEVDVGSLRRVFEDVPDWVVGSKKKKEPMVKIKHKEEKSLVKEEPHKKSSMAHIFGDLERASEDIMNLKEQTLARLVDIEGAIKKALFSVSTLKSESDIAGLSCLFKESLGTMQASANISKISIESSRTQSQKTKENPIKQRNTALSAAGPTSEGASAKQRLSPPSSPAYISIQSGLRKPESTLCPTCQQTPKTEEKFLSTKTLACNSPAQTRKKDPRTGGQKQLANSSLNPKRELSVLEVQTDPQGNSIMGTKKVTENYEHTDTFGNRFYSQTSTVVTTQPGTMTSSTGQTFVSPTTYQFQPPPPEMCSACQRPVYPMEKITADKYIFHKTCFVCKHCKKKLSIQNYTPVLGEFYCIFHYKQMLRKKGNYEEGSGSPQHKSQWSVKKTAAVVGNESEA